MDLPDAITMDDPIDKNNNSVCFGTKVTDVSDPFFRHNHPLGCLMSSFLKMEFKDFRKAPIVGGLRTAFQRIITKMNEGQPRRLAVDDTAPIPTSPYFIVPTIMRTLCLPRAGNIL